MSHSENQLLAKIYADSRGLYDKYSYVEVGPGSDCAVVGSASRSLLKTDSVVEGVHFANGTDVKLIAKKAVARTLSDIAAMAGTPRAALAACVLPRGYQHASNLFNAVRSVCDMFGCPLVGGDISKHIHEQSSLILTISILGDAHPDVTAPRSGARVGDRVYVSGALGGSLGVNAMGRHLHPQPRLELARELAKRLGNDLHSMMDISDGLGMDAGRIATASSVDVIVIESTLPIHEDVPVDLTRWQRALAALGDGEDYELLFTTPAQLPACLCGVSLTCIGEVVPGEGACFVHKATGERMNATELGYQH